MEMLSQPKMIEGAFQSASRLSCGHRKKTLIMRK
jgi:hypothetical protein